MSEFWYSSRTMLAEKGGSFQSFSLFGPVHLTWLAIAVVIWTGGALLFRSLDKKGRRNMLLSLALFAFIYEIIINIAYIATGQWYYGVLPLHLCGINIFVILFYSLKPCGIIAEFLYAVCLPGALAALLTPSWTALPMLNFFHIHSEILHIVLVLFPILLLVDGLRPNVRNLWKLFLMVLALCTPIYFLNFRLGTNFFFVHNDDGNALLVALGKIFPDYRLGLFALIAVLWLIMFLPWTVAAKLKKSDAK